jgi:hypothetical protein
MKLSSVSKKKIKVNLCSWCEAEATHKNYSMILIASYIHLSPLLLIPSHFRWVYWRELFIRSLWLWSVQNKTEATGYSFFVCVCSTQSKTKWWKWREGRKYNNEKKFNFPLKNFIHFIHKWRPTMMMTMSQVQFSFVSLNAIMMCESLINFTLSSRDNESSLCIFVLCVICKRISLSNKQINEMWCGIRCCLFDYPHNLTTFTSAQIFILAAHFNFLRSIYFPPRALSLIYTVSTSCDHKLTKHSIC